MHYMHLLVIEDFFEKTIDCDYLFFNFRNLDKKRPGIKPGLHYLEF